MSTAETTTAGRTMAEGLAAGGASGGPTPGAPVQRIGRLEPSALRGVLVREIINFSSYWRGSAFSSTMEPTIYLLAFGFGFGSIVSQVGGYDYIDFVGTGTVATAVLFSTAMPAMFGTWVKYKFQGTYGAILAAPVDTEELVTAEALWMAIRASVFGCAPLVVALLFGLEPSAWMLVVPFINFIAGFGWACFGVCVAAFMKAMESFSYVTSGFITPVMLTAGTFFRSRTCPTGCRCSAGSTRCTTPSSSSATPPSAGRAGSTSPTSRSSSSSPSPSGASRSGACSASSSPDRAAQRRPPKSPWLVS